jgi:membrane-bound lytic murein transglycosylase A
VAQRRLSPRLVLFGSSALILALAGLVLAGCGLLRPLPAAPTPAPAPSPPPLPPAPPLLLRLETVPFAELDGWAQDDPRGALQAFLRSCAVLTAKPDEAPLGGLSYAGTVVEWRQVCGAATLVPSDSAEPARRFFELEFVPYRVGQDAGPGLFTGYYEPQLRGSRTRHGAYQTPLYGVPSDLVNVDLGLFRENLKGQRIVGRVTDGRLVLYPPRAEIESGLGTAVPILFVDDAIDAFFLQIQGSGRVVLDDGTVVRAAYAAQNGRPYTAIGAVLIQRGELKREAVSMQSIRAWMLEHPAEAQQLMNTNASYVFFEEQPIGDASLGAAGAQGVPLTPEASLAVDLTVHALGVPVWLDTIAPDPDTAKPDRPFQRLLVIQDTGGAIRGPVRGDVYWGYSPEAGSIAGRMRSEGRMTVLLPRSVASRLGPNAELIGR